MRLKLAIASLALASIQLCLAPATLAQVSDGDDTFQAYHQDIGRISGSPARAQVAPQTTVVMRGHQAEGAAPSPDAGPLPASVTQVFERPAVVHQQHQQQHQQHQQQQQLFAAAPRARNPPQHQNQQQHQQQQQQTARRPNRITLAPRRDPQPDRLIATPPAVPLVPVQLPAPTLAEPSYAPPAAPAFASAVPEYASAPLATPSLATSVSARHAALIAQVAAERAAAASASADSHVEAPTAAIVQVQPPPPQQHPAHNQLVPLRTSPTNQHVGAGSSPAQFVDQIEEPIVAPSFEHVLSKGCPHKGVFSYENKDHCDRYYMCTNGTFTEEACPNGLAYSQMGAVYQHCAYNWNVDCGRKKTSEPIASPGCPWQFGIFPIAQNGRCSIDYFACEWGVPEPKRCSPEGLFYDDRIKGCQWADQLGCKSEALLNFKCPAEDEDNPYWPYPRYYHTKQDVIVCVNEQPRLVHCNEEQIVEPSSLACIDLVKKKPKKHMSH